MYASLQEHEVRFGYMTHHTINQDSLFQELPEYPWLFGQRDIMFYFNDRVYESIIYSDIFRRLKKITFLGAIDYLIYPQRWPSWRRQTRFDHSIGVGLLAMDYCRREDLDDWISRHLVVAGLLHDIGHGPLSHSLEPTFDKYFGINHHVSGLEMIRSDRHGKEIRSAIRENGLDIDILVDLLSGDSKVTNHHIFTGPINIDTIEAICRVQLYYSNNPVMHPIGLARHIIKSYLDDHDVKMADAFWRFKSEVYRFIVWGPYGSLADELSQYYMSEHIEDFGRDDFFLNDYEFLKKHRGMHNMLDALREKISDGLPLVGNEWRTDRRSPTFTIRRRIYKIDESAKVGHSQAYVERYRRGTVESPRKMPRPSIQELSQKRSKGDKHYELGLISKEFSELEQS